MFQVMQFLESILKIKLEIVNYSLLLIGNDKQCKKLQNS